MSNIYKSYIGIINNDIIGYKLYSHYSYIEYGYSKILNKYIIYNICTPNIDNRNKGYATELIHYFFNNIINNERLDIGPYTISGEKYIKHIIDEYAKLYNIKIL